VTEFEQSLVSLGISAATAFSLPKSVGALYGLAFARVEPLAFDEFVEALEMSKGSVSQGLKFLQRMGALHPVHVVGDRRTLYAPELSLRRLLIGVLNENVMPHLQQSGDQVARLKEQLAAVGDEEAHAILEDRLETLEGWGKKTRRVWPLVERALGRPLGRKDDAKLVGQEF
jgi:DNA-binding transcriptional regulator GbsR (MarR family)